MAIAIMRLELDGGKIIDIQEKSQLAVYGGGDAVLLAQEAFITAVRAIGVAVSAPAPEPSTESKEGEPDGSTGDGGPVDPGTG